VIPERSQQPPVLVVVIATVGENTVWFLAWPAGLASDRPGVEIFDQWDQLGDVVAVATGQADRERDAARINQQMVL
jgi:hypothetical protein